VVYSDSLLIFSARSSVWLSVAFEKVSRKDRLHLTNAFSLRILSYSQLKVVFLFGHGVQITEQESGNVWYSIMF